MYSVVFTKVPKKREYKTLVAHENKNTGRHNTLG